jgi:hypothetical protein
MAIGSITPRLKMANSRTKFALFLPQLVAMISLFLLRIRLNRRASIGVADASAI